MATSPARRRLRELLIRQRIRYCARGGVLLLLADTSPAISAAAFPHRRDGVDLGRAVMII
jgi:hypothetical protein